MGGPLANLTMNGEARATAGERRAEAGHAEGLRNPGALARDRALVLQESREAEETRVASSARKSRIRGRDSHRDTSERGEGVRDGAEWHGGRTGAGSLHQRPRALLR